MSHDDTPPAWLRRARYGWTHTGQKRPPFAREPAPGQESVWDYPRPPALVADTRDVLVCADGKEIGRSVRTVRVLETASPPTFYLPPEDVRMNWLTPVSDRTFCEWKGEAVYWALRGGDGGPVAWAYPDPFEAFRELAGYLSFYPGRVDCFVDGESVKAQAGGYYGGWITAEIIGPFKGEAGTKGW